MVAVSGIDSEFYPAAWKVGLALGLSPERAGYDVAKLLFSESSITPSAQNSIGCVGINQFCPGSQPAGISPAAYKNLPASQQLLSYVWPFWATRVGQHGGIDRIRDLYWLNYYPATYKRGSPDNAIVNPRVGAGDAVLARGKTYVTAADLDAFIASRCHGTRWLGILGNLSPYAVPALLGGKNGLVALGIAGAAAGTFWYLFYRKGARVL